MPDTDELPARIWPRVAYGVMLVCLVATAANAIQGSRSKGIQAELAAQNLRSIDDRKKMHARLDKADAERERLKGEIDVLKGMVSGLADPGVERD